MSIDAVQDTGVALSSIINGLEFDVPRHYLDVEPDEEIIVGNLEFAHIPFSRLFVFPQVRAGLNPMDKKLTDSIEAQDLDNYLNVALLDQQGLLEYAEFVSRTWRLDINPSDYAHLRDSDGNYSLVIAGHSRYESIGKVLDRRPNGRARAKVGCKIHRNYSPQDIIAKQLAENIHKEPPLERQAIAIVEAYFWGLEKGEFKDEKGFRAAYEGKISKRTLGDALDFAVLPASVRDHVFAGTLAYAPAIALGKMAPLLREWIRVKIFDADDDAFEKFAEHVDELVEEKLLTIVAHLQNRRLNGPAAVKYITAHTDEYAQQTTQILNGDAAPELRLRSMDEVFAEQQSIVRREFNIELSALANEPLEHISAALRIFASHRRFLSAAAHERLEERAKSYFKTLGSRAIG